MDRQHEAAETHSNLTQWCSDRIGENNCRDSMRSSITPGRSSRRRHSTRCPPLLRPGLPGSARCLYWLLPGRACQGAMARRQTCFPVEGVAGSRTHAAEGVVALRTERQTDQHSRLLKAPTETPLMETYACSTKDKLWQQILPGYRIQSVNPKPTPVPAWGIAFVENNAYLE